MVCSKLPHPLRKEYIVYNSNARKIYSNNLIEYKHLDGIPYLDVHMVSNCKISLGLFSLRVESIAIAEKLALM